MRDFIKILIVGIVISIFPQVYAGDYKVLVLPDNIVTENAAVDAYIYNASAEFFADEVINLLNSTDNISAPSVSETRISLKSNPADIIAARNLANRFRTSYNIDYVALKKLTTKFDARYALILTSYVDAENYITRRTVWDFLNIPGATVIDPAYKISTYAVLIDTEKNAKLWSDTFYKTISTCENRIITRGPSPQTEQLQKIKDYSKYLCPQIAQNVQVNVLPAEVLADESNQIDYDMGNIDNVFTKKYRHIGKESNKVYQQGKSSVVEFSKDTKARIDRTAEKIKASNAEKKAKKLEAQQSKLEVKAKPVYPENVDNINSISNTTEQKAGNIKNAVFKKNTNELNYPELINIEINKKKKNSLFGDFNIERPSLRDYN